jgi:hypothetical protein
MSPQHTTNFNCLLFYCAQSCSALGRCLLFERVLLSAVPSFICCVNAEVAHMMALPSQVPASLDDAQAIVISI